MRLRGEKQGVANQGDSHNSEMVQLRPSCTHLNRAPSPSPSSAAPRATSPTCYSSLSSQSKLTSVSIERAATSALPCSPSAPQSHCEPERSTWTRTPAGCAYSGTAARQLVPVLFESST